MLWNMQLDNKLKKKGHDENHRPFTFSFRHIQLDTTITNSVDADITIDIIANGFVNENVSIL